MRRADTGDLWWKNAVFYCTDIGTFYDSDGDGTGDIRGMTDRLEYLTDLAVTCLWLMPFYPTARSRGFPCVVAQTNPMRIHQDARAGS
jgi:1,4-alpha-glucan branching enzyme